VEPYFLCKNFWVPKNFISLKIKSSYKIHGKNKKTEKTKKIKEK